MGVIPVSGENYYYFKGDIKKIEPLLFGNISGESLNAIWHKKEYKKFIREHRNNIFVQSCKYCQKRFVIGHL